MDSRDINPINVANGGREADLICFSHLRWNFVHQRPQHLMTRFARRRRVFYVEEPIFGSVAKPVLQISTCPNSGVQIGVPVLPDTLSASETPVVLRQLTMSLLDQERIHDHVAWFYTPMAMSFADDLRSHVTVYDCMDELSLFRGASPALIDYEKALFERADLVFTGGQSLFEAKRSRHHQVYPFPSSVDVPHFARARVTQLDPADQAGIPHPRVGYAGVIDERLDARLIRELARKRPDWQIVMLGPVVKIQEDELPRAPNIHYLGMKQYADLPSYFSTWEAAMLPFALNEATKFISPTKTPEYLAAGLPVVSTPIRDVMRPYGELGLARIAADAEEFAAALDDRIAHGVSRQWREQADMFLSTLSWDNTWGAMNRLVATAELHRKRLLSNTNRMRMSVVDVAASHV